MIPPELRERAVRKLTQAVCITPLRLRFSQANLLLGCIARGLSALQPDSALDALDDRLVFARAQRGQAAGGAAASAVRTDAAADIPAEPAVAAAM